MLYVHCGFFKITLITNTTELVLYMYFSISSNNLLWFLTWFLQQQNIFIISLRTLNLYSKHFFLILKCLKSTPKYIFEFYWLLLILYIFNEKLRLSLKNATFYWLYFNNFSVQWQQWNEINSFLVFAFCITKFNFLSLLLSCFFLVTSTFTNTFKFKASNPGGVHLNFVHYLFHTLNNSYSYILVQTLIKILRTYLWFCL